LSNTDRTHTQFKPGTPAAEWRIALCEPELRGNEWKYVKKCLDSGWISSVGSFVDRFEHELTAYVGAEYGVATSSGTAALHIALIVSGVQPEDEVLVSTLTFVAPANAIRYVGAQPVFMDSEPNHWQMDTQKVTDFLEQECRWGQGKLRNKTTGRTVSAILPVHILGHPVDIDAILKIAHKYDLTVIEDAAESLGARYKKTMAGTLGDISCFSFNGNKIITTGGGGMIVTENEDWARKAKYLTTQARDDPIEYIHNEIGYNYRLTNMQAAIGCAQIEQVKNYIAAKRRIAAYYNEQFISIPGIKIPKEAEWASSTSWLYTVLIDSEKYGIDSRALMNSLHVDRIQTRPLWHPVHDLPPYEDCQAYRVEVAQQLYQRGLSLPCSVGLEAKLAELQRVVTAICKAPSSKAKHEQ
jgi:perosamine synthetase